VILGDALVAQNIFFGLIAAAVVVGAVRVVTTRNVVHAALYLVAVLAGVGASFLLLGAEFVGITQILVYIGAIVVLFLFGVMLTRAPIGKNLQLTNSNWGVPLLVALLIGGLLSYTLIDAFHGQQLPADAVPQTTAQVSDSIFGQYLIPFEVVSLLLLAALVGAIVIARRD
jgi:NADH-quinone oxidoreductase subunit J